MEKKFYELWYRESDKQAILMDVDNEKMIKSLFKDNDKMIIKFEAFSVTEAMLKMSEFLKMFNKNK